MATIMGLIALILVSSVLFSPIDSALPGKTGCASIVCPRVSDKMTNSIVQLVPKLVPPSSQVLSNLMGFFSDTNDASTWTCVYPDIDECESSPCSSRHRCIDGHRSFTCECKTGYAGPNCEFNINECSSHPCQNGATCLDRLNGYSCSCKVWFGGSHCQSRNIYETTSCQNNDTSLNCGPDHSIHIVDAAYGRASDAYVCSVNITLPVDCFISSVLAVKETCEGESTCVFYVNDVKFEDPCITFPKYLTMGHQCLCRFHTPDSGVNHNYHWLFPVSRITNGRFEFLVRTPSDAYVGLADQASLYGDYVEIVMCGWSNTASAMTRNCLGCNPVARTPGTFCGSDAFSGFWITFAEGLFKMGLADQTEPFIEWQDPNPFDVTHVGVFSGNGSDADWMFYSDYSP